MALLRWVPALLLVACYSPEYRNCAVTCATEAECSPGQVCGDDSLCATPAVAGQCAQLVGADASLGIDASVDARLVDAAPPLDAPMVQLKIKVSGNGLVEVAGEGTCPAGPLQCTYAISPGVPLTMTATANPGWMFDKWSSPCGSQAMCTITPTQSVTMEAKFKPQDDD